MSEQQASWSRPDARGPRASFDRVVQRLDAMGLIRGKWRGNDLMARCPVHDEKTPSLHVTWQDSLRGGRTMVWCHGCTAPATDIADALGLSVADLFDEPLPERDRSPLRGSKSTDRRRSGQRRGKLGALPARLSSTSSDGDDEPVHTWAETDRYQYQARDGQVVEEVIRRECGSCGDRHKSFIQSYLSPTGSWVNRKPAGFIPVLYRAPQVAQAVRDGVVVYVPEGEKDVHTAEGLGLVATTNAQGANTRWTEDQIDALAGAAVVVVMDRDAPGYTRGLELYRRLTGAGSTVTLTLPAVEVPKADLTDHVHAGYGIDELVTVGVDEVALWVDVGRTEAAAAKVREATLQARLRWDLAESGTEEEVNRRFARRWAGEAEIRFEAFQDQIDQVTVRGVHSATAWVSQALEAAESLLRQTIEDCRRCHLELGLPVPARLRQRIDRPTGSAVGNDQHDLVLHGDHSASPADPDASVWRDEPGVRSVASSFRVIGGQIVQWEANPPGRRSDWEADADGDGSFKVLLSTVVHVTAREYLETEDETDVDDVPLLGRSSSGRKPVSTPRALVAVRLQYPDPVTKEWMEIRVMADQWHDHSWLEALPGHPDYDHKRAGLDQLQRAILAVSPQVHDQVLYRSTGWREAPDGTHRYIHRRGAITAAGHEDVEVAFSGPISRFDLPDPIQDPMALREAWWQGSATMLDRVPQRVAAPLLGQVFRSVLGHNGWVMVLVGPPGSYKTSVAAKAMHHLGELWDQKKPASSMSGNGDTLNAVRLKLHAAKDALYWMDDFAPTKSWLEAQKLLEETVRLIHNREARSRSTRDGLSVNEGGGPRASGLCTSEVMPRPGSGAERMVVVPLAQEDVDKRLLFPLNEAASRHQRALVMSSFISWLARDLPGRRTRYLEVADQYADRLMAAGESVRAAQGLANMWIGWVAMTEFLLEAQAITAQERQELLERVDTSLFEAAKAAVDPDMPRTTGARVRELIGYSLRQGLAYVDDVRTGECPPWPLASQLGWRRTTTEIDPTGMPSRQRYDRCGMRLGYVLHDPDQRERGRLIMCESTALEALLKAASGTQTERLEIDRNTALRALHDDGTLIPDTSEPGRVRHTVKCKLYAEDRTCRMVALHLDKILGEEPDDPGDGAADDTTTLPGLDPAGPDSNELPAADPATSDDPAPTELPLGDVDPHPVAAPNDPGDAGIVDHHQVDAPRPDQPDPQENPVNDSPRYSRPLPRQTRPATAAAAAARPFAGSGVASDFRAVAAVVDVTSTYLSNGESVPTPAIQHVGELAQFAQQLNLGNQTTKFLTDSGQVWLTDAMAQQLGIDMAQVMAHRNDADFTDRLAELTRDLPAVRTATAEGWTVGRGDGLTRWTRVWQGQVKSTWIVLTGALNPDPRTTPLLEGDPEPSVLAWRIGLLASALGAPYKVSPSTTGLDLMVSLRWKDRQQYFQMLEPIQPATIATIEVETNWTRKPTADEAGHEWLHAYDRSGSYLAGVAGLDLGIGVPTHHPEGTAFAKLPGYWHINVPEAGDWRVPNPLDPTGKQWGRTRWVTTPGLQFAIEQGYDPEIMEAYTWSQHARVLDPWYEQIRDARARLDRDDEDAQIARNELKMIYATTIGMLGSGTFMKGRAEYAPDWRHHIVSKARTNVLRRVQTIGRDTGRWPVAILADTILYTSPDPDPQAAWPGGEKWWGRELGKYKAEGSVRLADHAHFLDGGPYRGKQEISDSGDLLAE